MAQHVTETLIGQWGNGLAVRLNKSLTNVAGVYLGTPIKITAKPGMIVVESVIREPSLDELLAQFDPSRHGGEVMAFAPIGKEVM